MDDSEEYIPRVSLFIITVSIIGVCFGLIGIILVFMGIAPWLLPIYLFTFITNGVTMFGLFKSYVKNTAAGAGSSMVSLLAKLDPEGMSEAQIDEMDNALTEVTRQKVRAEADWKREQQEADVIKVNYDRRMSAAERIQKKMDEATSENDKIKFAEALGQLLDEIEKMSTDVDREVEEAKQAEAYFRELEDVVKTASEKLKTARKTLKDAQHRIERAEIAAKRAKEQEDQAKVLAGIKQGLDSGNAALDAMSKRAEKLEEDARVAKEKANMLSPTSSTSNSIIEDALKDTEKPVSTESLSDRLARLKK